jgi:threonine/homoserine/homoserine lactone efflux protein
MEPTLFAQGMLVGITLAAPVGPIALVCIQRALTVGRWHGIASGLGVATADAFYAAITVFWITLLSGFLLEWQWIFRVAGGIVLLGVGFWIFRTVPPEVPGSADSNTYTKDFAATLVLTLANLLTIVFFVALLPGFGVVFSGGSFVPAAVFVLGLFAGEAVWWVAISWLLGSLHTTLTRARLTLINRFAGLLIIAFGIALILSAVIR